MVAKVFRQHTRITMEWVRTRAHTFKNVLHSRSLYWCYSLATTLIRASYEGHVTENVDRVYDCIHGQQPVKS
jgi:hypothetical protein